MGFLDRLAGRHSDKVSNKEAESEVASTSTPSAPAELLHDVAPVSSTSGFGPPTISSSQIAAASNVLGGSPSSFGGPGGLPGLGGAPSGRLYDPYEGISQAVGVKKHAFKLPERVEFVFEEEAAIRRRGWTENLQFYTGLGYITGGGAGVAAGSYKYLTSKPEFVGPETLKLKTNRFLNSAGSFARPFGNACGILGLFYSSFESYLASQLDLPGVPDGTNSVLAGAVSGALFRIPRGPRQAAIAGAVGAVAGGGIAMLRTVFPSL